MRTAGLLNTEQLQTVFSNLDELITINDRFADQLLDALEGAVDIGYEVRSCRRNLPLYITVTLINN